MIDRCESPRGADLAEWNAAALELKARGERLQFAALDPERRERTQSMLAELDKMFAEIEAEVDEEFLSHPGGR